ncbi:MAG: hypothetical protein LRY73_06340 [Bacillus sp. (in: Bacteria)]|nr:hypothetical protein [Bacillus sp. (in: firmicutes)]
MEEKIHYSNLMIMVYMIQSAILLFSLPRILAEGFGTNGWLAVFLLSFIGLVNILLINLVYTKGKGRAVTSILEEALPKWIYYPMYLLMIGFFWSYCRNWWQKTICLLSKLIYFRRQILLF